MSMDKRWGETFARLEAIEAQLRELNQREPVEAVLEVGFEVTKEELTKIKGVGDALADEILKVINR